MPVIVLDDCDSFPSMKSPAVCTSLKTGDGLNKSCSAQNTSKLSVDLSHDTSVDKSSSDLNDTDYDQDYDFDYSDYDKDKDPSDDDDAAKKNIAFKMEGICFPVNRANNKRISNQKSSSTDTIGHQK